MEIKEKASIIKATEALVKLSRSTFRALKLSSFQNKSGDSEIDNRKANYFKTIPNVNFFSS